MSYYCEMCGREVDVKVAKRILFEGSQIIVCPECYSRLSKRSIVRESAKRSTRALVSATSTKVKVVGSGRNTSLSQFEKYEVVENYYQVIKSAREKLGWSQEVLASKIGESVNIIKRIESGKLKPNLELAKRLERVLKVKLLEPVVVEVSKYTQRSSSEDLTVGNLITMQKHNEKENKGS